MTLAEYLLALRRHWIVIAALTVICGIGAFGYAQTLPEQYRSVASVMVIPERGDNASELVQGSSYVQNIVQSYAVLAASPAVLQPVVEDLRLSTSASQLANQVSINTPLNTVVIEIAVVDGDPEMAQKIAAGAAESLSDRVAELSPQGSDGTPAVRIETIAPARLPTYPIAPNVRLYTALGLGAGLVLGLAYAILRRVVDSRIRESSDVTGLSDVPVVGEIPILKRDSTLPGTALLNPSGHMAEALRTLSVNLTFVSLDSPLNVIVVTSSTTGEGKSSVTLGLAVALSESGKRVIVIDADLRRPAIGSLTELEEAVGLTNLLLGDGSLATTVQSWTGDGLDVLTSGSLPPNPGQLMASSQLEAVIAEARAAYDVVIIDSAPVLTVSDALWLTKQADGVLVVARSGMTRRRQLQRALAALESTKTGATGIVLNAVRGDPRSPYYVHENPAPEPYSGTSNEVASTSSPV